MLETDARVAAVAATHHGVFSREHARQVGISDGEISRRLSVGAWLELHRSVYRNAATPASWRGDLLAACWAGGFRAYASHRSAAALWGLPGGTKELIEITCPRWRRARHESLVVHETKAFHHIDITAIENIPVTTVPRTLLDLGAVRSSATVEIAADRALNLELTDFDEVHRLLRRVGRSGRNGAGVLRSVVRQRGPTLGRPASPRETQMLQILRRHGLPVPELQYEVHVDGLFVARPDAAYPQWMLAIEYDSDEFHLGVRRRRIDSDRRNHLLRVQWTVITAHAGDIRSGGRELVRTIRSHARRFGVV